MAAKIYVGKSASAATRNQERLKKKAEATASAILVPASIEFASFEFEGKNFAISARMVVEVDLLTSRVPSRVIRGKH